MKAIDNSHKHTYRTSPSLRLSFRGMVLVLLAVISFVTAGAVVLPQDTTVAMVTFFPGSEIYELEGHAALRITTPEKDVAITYGVFDFNKPNFVYRFVKGETDYMVAEVPWPLFEYEYRSQNRRIVSQQLDLNALQKARLIDLINENLRPENRVYRYNYVRDNCATRPLRMVELAIGDSIYLTDPVDKSDLTTFRQFMRLYHSNYPWYQFGIDIALGTGIDETLDAREKSFAPVVMVDQLENARVGSPEGKLLVADTKVLCDVEPFGAIEGPTPWYASPSFVCWLVTLSIVIYAIYLVYVRRRYPRLIAAVMFALSGLAGLLVAFLVFVSVHEATSPNANLLWLNPLCFVPVVTLWIKSARKVTAWYMMLNFSLLLGLLVIWMLGVQSPNSAFIPLVLGDMTLSVLYIYYFKKLEKAD